jgi:hypothetical protein
MNPSKKILNNKFSKTRLIHEFKEIGQWIDLKAQGNG